MLSYMPSAIIELKSMHFEQDFEALFKHVIRPAKIVSGKWENSTKYVPEMSFYAWLGCASTTHTVTAFKTENPSEKLYPAPGCI